MTHSVLLVQLRALHPLAIMSVLALKHAEQHWGMMQWQGGCSVVFIDFECVNFLLQALVSPVSDAFKLRLLTNFSCQEIGFRHHFQLVIDNAKTSVTAPIQCHIVAGL